MEKMKLVDGLKVKVNDEDYVKEVFRGDVRHFIFSVNPVTKALQRVNTIKLNTLQAGLKSGRYVLHDYPGYTDPRKPDEPKPKKKKRVSFSNKMRRLSFQKGNRVFWTKEFRRGVVERRISTGYYIVRFDNDEKKYCYIDDLLAERIN